jgi:haloalkane dehalogenase
MSTISHEDNRERKRVSVLDSEIAYVDTGNPGDDAVVMLHGNPTSSYLWRNVVSEVEGAARCLTPDLIGMGQSGKKPSGEYTFVEHAKFLDAWFDAVLPTEKIILVIHDWGSALGFHWANRHRDRVQGIVYMEAIVQPIASWDDWPESARDIFKSMRSDAGEAMILEKNLFIEAILPSSVIRGLTDEEMEVYRKPSLEPGESRRPTLTWPRQIPLVGEPADVVEIVDSYGDWISEDDSLPKLFINADPGIILIGKQREYCRTWPNQEEITVKGTHFIQEDSPVEIGQAVAGFVAKVRG